MKVAIETLNEEECGLLSAALKTFDVAEEYLDMKQSLIKRMQDSEVQLYRLLPNTKTKII